MRVPLKTILAGSFLSVASAAQADDAVNASGACIVGNQTEHLQAIDPNLHFGVFAELVLKELRVYAIDRVRTVSLNIQGPHSAASTELPKSAFVKGTPLVLDASIDNERWVQCRVHHPSHD